MLPGNVDKSSRYLQGAVLYEHKGKLTISSVGSKSWDAYLNSLKNIDYALGSIPIEVANRPDLISNIWFGSAGYWWKIMCINGVYDPFESLNGGEPTLVPHQDL